MTWEKIDDTQYVSEDGRYSIARSATNGFWVLRETRGAFTLRVGKATTAESAMALVAEVAR